MTTHLTKIWWDLNKHKLVEQAIPEAEIYNREWVSLTDDEFEKILKEFSHDPRLLAVEIEARLTEKNI
jgi:hypothetical protein